MVQYDAGPAKAASTGFVPQLRVLPGIHVTVRLELASVATFAELSAAHRRAKRVRTVLVLRIPATTVCSYTELDIASAVVAAKPSVAARPVTIVWIRLGESAVLKLQLVRVFVLVECRSAAPQGTPVAITILEAISAAGRVRRALRAE